MLTSPTLIAGIRGHIDTAADTSAAVVTEKAVNAYECCYSGLHVLVLAILAG